VAGFTFKTRVAAFLRQINPIAFEWGTLDTNYHGPKESDNVLGSTLKDCWRVYPVKGALRIHFVIYRYFWNGGSVFWFIGFKWWRRNTKA
jgi:hypothetical protein